MRWDRLEWSSGRCGVPERNQQVMENGRSNEGAMSAKEGRDVQAGLALGALGFNEGSGAYWEERDGGIRAMSFF